MVSKINILLIAYACNPKQSSEQAVGWSNVVGISKLLPDKNIFVLTRKKHKQAIEEVGTPKNVNFFYFDFPNWILRIKRRLSLTRIHYYFWVIGSGLFIRSKGINFNLVHHVTFVTDSVPSPALFIKAQKFIWGPVGGNDYIQRQFFTSTRNYARYTALWIFKVVLRKIDPLLLATKAKANVVIGINEQNKSIVSNHLREKFLALPAISINPNFQKKIPSTNSAQRSFICLSIGKFIDIKNQNLTLEVFCQFLSRIKSVERRNCQLIMIGEGPNLPKIVEKVKENGVSPFVTFIDKVSFEETAKYYAEASVVLHPTLENAGYVFLEAMISGNPILALNAGGAKSFISSNISDQLVNVNKKYDAIISDLTDRLFSMYLDKKLRDRVAFQNKIDVLALHSDIAHMEKIIEIYKSTLNEK